VAGIQTSSTG